VLKLHRNTEGTIAYQPRIHRFTATFTPSTQYPSPPNLFYTYNDTILLTDSAGTAFSGLDPNTQLCLPSFPCLPAATFPGDGFGGLGTGGTRASLDPEGIALAKDGGFWISDEYGPYLYRFDKTGKMTSVTVPPDSLLPIRNGEVNFASNNPPRYNLSQIPQPEDPTSGRANNQGFEGLSYDAKENALYVLLQSASINNGGLEKTTNRYTTLLKYELDKKGQNPKYAGQWVVPLPQYQDPTKKPSAKPRTAAASELLALGGGRFFALSRDGFGRGDAWNQSVYRQADVFSINNATDVKGRFDNYTDAFAPDGVLTSSVTPAKYCSFLDFNVPSELGKFGLTNGGAVDSDALLNEKWEGLALVPVHGEKKGEYYLFASNDNDFITQNGFYNFGQDTYADESGFNLLSQTLVFRISIQ
jgi:hypothetical protein